MQLGRIPVVRFFCLDSKQIYIFQKLFNIGFQYEHCTFYSTAE